MYVDFLFSVEYLTKEIANELTLITDTVQLNKWFRDLFAGYLDIYMKRENEWLVSRMTGHLTSFYGSRSHQKRSTNNSGYFVESDIIYG